MSDKNNALVHVDLGGLSKPVTVSIEKISDAVGGLAKPGQIRKTAAAEADAAVVKARARIEITEMEERALQRMVREEGQKQENMEDITAQAVPHIKEDVDPDAMDKDWITNFFDKCRLISDEEMKSLWAKMLAGEANAPGAFSRKTIETVTSLDKDDVAIFTSFCRLCWAFRDVIVPLIYDDDEPIAQSIGINFSSLTHLESLGLIHFSPLSGYKRTKLGKQVVLHYYGRPLFIEFPKSLDNDMNCGKVMLTRAGQQLAKISGAAPLAEHYDYVLERWLQDGYSAFCPIATRPAHTKW